MNARGAKGFAALTGPDPVNPSKDAEDKQKSQQPRKPEPEKPVKPQPEPANQEDAKETDPPVASIFVEPAETKQYMKDTHKSTNVWLDKEYLEAFDTIAKNLKYKRTQLLNEVIRRYVELERQTRPELLKKKK